MLTVFPVFATFWHVAFLQCLRILESGFVLINEDLDSSVLTAAVKILHRYEGHCFNSLVMAIPRAQRLAVCFEGGLVLACKVSMASRAFSTVLGDGERASGLEILFGGE